MNEALCRAPLQRAGRVMERGIRVPALGGRRVAAAGLQTQLGHRGLSPTAPHPRCCSPSLPCRRLCARALASPRRSSPRGLATGSAAAAATTSSGTTASAGSHRHAGEARSGPQTAACAAAAVRASPTLTLLLLPACREYVRGNCLLPKCRFARRRRSLPPLLTRGHQPAASQCVPAAGTEWDQLCLG